MMKTAGIFFWCCGLKIQNTLLIFEKSLGNCKNQKAIPKLLILERPHQKMHNGSYLEYESSQNQFSEE